MNRSVVFVPQQMHPRGSELLAEHCEIITAFGSDAQSWDQALRHAEGILIRTDSITGDHIRAAPKLRVIARHGVGVDNIDVATATERGIVVANAPTSNTLAVAEHVFALLLGVGRQVLRADRDARSGSFDTRPALAGISLRGKRFGIIGIGRIGTEVARIALGFGMRVHAYDPYLHEDEVRTRGAVPESDLARLLASSDIVSPHVPLTAETKGLLGEFELALLAPHAVLIHTARGGVVDEAALAARLHAGKIAGAGVDVFECEPPPADSPLLAAPNVVASPHIASHTREAVELMATQAAEAIVAVLTGRTPDSVVNPEVLDTES